jgi:hypothetical protein
MLWKQPRYLTTDEWIKKMWYLHTMEFYSATKKNEILSITSKWMELENVILSKVSLRRSKITYSPHYYRTKSNTAMLLDMGHTLSRDSTKEK